MGRRLRLKRTAYFVVAALMTLIVLMPSALAQDLVPGGDDDPYLPEPNALAVGSNEELERIAGQPVPSLDPGEPPEQGLPKTGGPSASAMLPAAALLLVGSGVLAYAVLRRGR